GRDVQVPVTFGGTADDPDDYSPSTSTITITEGSTTANLTLTVDDDDLDEDNETVIVTIGSPTNATASGTTVHTATINDNDALPSVEFNTSAQSNDESVSPVTITVDLSAVSGRDVEVDLAYGGSASDPGDYTTSHASSLIISEGQMSADITLTVVDDAVPEATKTVVVTMSMPDNATLGTTTVHTATITDSDSRRPGKGSLSFAKATYKVNENDGTAEITVRRTDGSEGAASVRCEIAEGTATRATDFAETVETLEWEDGDVGEKTCRVSILDDLDVEGGETVRLSLNHAEGASLGSPSNATLTIFDNEIPGELSFARASYEVEEGAGVAEIKVRRTEGSLGPLSVRCNTAAGTATEAGDYARTAATLEWADGDTDDKTCSVSILDDLDAEGDETEVLSLTDETRATLAA
ncbi:MAG: hypothetical protein GY708_16015, partial [Actinomycetia bacterium]|nr:hypothetical protein [Actinomycetes bacterium]